jgi:DeoR/GlpR family transcriptional regulator of sugar metabolism
MEMVVLSPRRRRQEIVRLASTNGLASVDDLSETFAVSPSTIRRDLAKLEADGQIARTYGGAIASYAHAESSLRQRMGEEYEAKRAIAHSAASQIDVEESIFLDAGSTVAALAREIRSRTDLTITTTSLIVLNELSRSEHPTINALGGTLRMISQGFVGPLAEAALENISFDRAFLGADSVDAELGICEADPHQTRLKQLAARRAKHVYVLAHAQKLGRRPFHAWTQLPRPWTIITNADNETVQPFKDNDVHVVQVVVQS